MFETSVVQARAQAAARRPLLFTLSISAHVAVIAAVVGTSIATVSLPASAPNQVTIPVFTSLPPMKGDGDRPKTTPAATPPQTVRRSTAPAAPVAPTVVPDSIAPVPAQASGPDTGLIATGPTTGSGDSTGPGVPWGSKDGVDVDGPPVIAAPPKIYTVSGDVKAPVVLRRVSPPYPEVARRIHLNGFVILQCIIDQTGRIRDAHVVSSSFAAFDQPALDAVYQWQFAPGTLNGQPVDVQFDLKVMFHVN